MDGPVAVCVVSIQAGTPTPYQFAFNPTTIVITTTNVTDNHHNHTTIYILRKPQITPLAGADTLCLAIYSASNHTMLSDNRRSPTCRSVGRVTCGLLLSFLALSSPASAYIRDAPAQVVVQLPPIEPSFPDTEHNIREDGAERFVSSGCAFRPLHTSAN